VIGGLWDHGSGIYWGICWGSRSPKRRRWRSGRSDGEGAFAEGGGDDGGGDLGLRRRDCYR